MTIRITFLCEEDGSEHVVEAAAGDKLTQVAFKGRVTIQQTCAGKASCTDCKILVKNAAADAFEAPTPAEVRQLGNVFFITKERLACQAVVRGDATVVVPKRAPKKEAARRK